MQDPKTLPAPGPQAQPDVKKGDAVNDAKASSSSGEQKKTGKFGQILGSVLGGALNIIAPGAGWLIGGLIRRGGTDFGSMEQLLQHSAQQQMQMLTIQERVQAQTQEFTTITNILKARHDAEMAAINNIRS